MCTLLFTLSLFTLSLFKVLQLHVRSASPQHAEQQHKSPRARGQPCVTVHSNAGVDAVSCSFSVQTSESAKPTPAMPSSCVLSGGAVRNC